MQQIWNQLTDQFTTYAPNLLAAIGVLIAGWLIALVLSFIVRKLLNKTALDNKLARWMAGPSDQKPIPVETWCARGVFGLITLVTLILFFYTLKISALSTPLQGLLDSIIGFLPNFIAAGLLTVVAWLVATVLRRILSVVLTSARMDQRLGGATSGDSGKPAPSIAKSISEAVYWLVFVLFLPAIVDALGLKSLLEPVHAMMNKAFAFLPNLLAAGLTLLAGWFIARIVQRLVSSLLASAGVDRLSEKWGLAPALGKRKFSEMLGLLLYFLILIPVIVSALNGLQLEAVTKPASDMLGKIMLMLPSIFGATLVMIIAWFVGRVVGGLATNLLASIGFNNLPVTLGLAKQPLQGRRAPAAVAGSIVQITILLFASIEAARLLGFDSVGTMVNEFIAFAGHIVMATLIFCLGLALAHLVAKAILTSDSPNAKRFALAARIAILALVGAMALRQTGLANEIITLAFGLTLGAAALAFALAFGLGGQEAASRSLVEWKGDWNKPEPEQERNRLATTGPTSPTS